MNLDKNPNYDPQSNPESPGQDCFVRHLRDFRPRRPQLDLEVLEFESPIHSGVPVAVPRSGFVPLMGAVWCGGMLIGALITFWWMADRRLNEETTARIDPVSSESDSSNESAKPSIEHSLVKTSEHSEPSASAQTQLPAVDTIGQSTRPIVHREPFYFPELMAIDQDLNLNVTSDRRSGRSFRLASRPSLDSFISKGRNEGPVGGFGDADRASNNLGTSPVQSPPAPATNRQMLIRLMSEDSI